MKTIGFVLVCVLAAGGCSKKSEKSTSACASAVSKGIDGMVASQKKLVEGRAKAGQAAPPNMLEGIQRMGDKLRIALTATCEADKWSDADLACFANASDFPSIKHCRETLPPEQAQHALAEIMKVMGGGMGMGGPGMGRMQGHPPMLQGSGAAPADGSAAAPAPGSAAAPAPGSAAAPAGSAN